MGRRRYPRFLCVIITDWQSCAVVQGLRYELRAAGDTERQPAGSCVVAARCQPPGGGGPAHQGAHRSCCGEGANNWHAPARVHECTW